MSLMSVGVYPIIMNHIIIKTTFNMFIEISPLFKCFKYKTAIIKISFFPSYLRTKPN